MDKLRRSWALTKESWGVLCADKTLLLFPLISSAALLLIMASFAVPLMFWIGGMDEAQREAMSSRNMPMAERVVLMTITFGFYFCTFTVMNYFNVALIGAALERFAGRPASVGVGLSIATKRIPQILAWSAVGATVGMVLKLLEERAGIFGRIAIALVGMAWAIGTFFVVPVLAAEGVGPITAIKRSVQVLKKTWGEAALTRLGVGVVFGLLTLLVVLVGAGVAVAAMAALDSVVIMIIAITVTVLAVIALSLLSTTLQTILQAALYRYAVDGRAPQGFDPRTLGGVFQPKAK